MDSDAAAITLFSRAEKALAKARTLEALKNARDLAQAAKTYIQLARCPRDTRLEAACLVIRAEHALGTALAKNANSRGRKGEARRRPKTLRELGISKAASHRAQLVTSLSRTTLEGWVTNQCTADQEPTLAGVRTYAARTGLCLREATE